MGYDFYITRKEDWSDSDGPQITLTDWTEYLFIENSLEIDRDHAAEVDPRVASGAKEATHARWLDWPGREPGVREAWVWLEAGNLIATDADTDFRRKLFLIADGLGARLMGENGEFYNSIGEVETGDVSEGKRPWWKFW